MRILVLCWSACLSVAVWSQTAVTVNEIAYSKVTFMDFHQASGNEDIQESATAFIEQKLKEQDAEDLAASKRDEILDQMRQKFAPSLIPSSYIKARVDSALQRSKTKIKAQHIFVSLENTKSMKDIVLAEAKARGLYQRLTEGESFEQVAVSASDERRVYQTRGHLGYLTTAQLPLPVEDSLYSMPLHSFSHPIQTKKGFYIVKKLAVRPNSLQYEAAVAFAASQSAIADIYNGLILKSLDEESVFLKKNWYRVGQLPIHIEEQLEHLADGQISQAFRFGHKWALLKLYGTAPVSYGEEELRQQFLGAAYAPYFLQEFLQKSKELIFYSEPDQAQKDVNFLLKKFGLDSLKSNNYVMKSRLYRIQDQSWTVADFLDYLDSKGTSKERLYDKEQRAYAFQQFTEERLIDFLLDEKKENDPIFAQEYNQYYQKLIFARAFQKRVLEKMSSKRSHEKYFKSNKERLGFEAATYAELSKEQKSVIENKLYKFLAKRWVKKLKKASTVVQNPELGGW